MWTPRRVVLLLGGILLFGGAYGLYARLLGWLDGLPPLPDRFHRSAIGGMPPPVRATSPTIERLREAFGPDCPEQHPAFYPTQLLFPNGESSIVLASGSPPINNGSKQIILTPFSLAVFGKPKPEFQRHLGEVPEISTFHADKAVLEFDRPVNGPNDMNRAKLLRMELVSEPESAIPDKRRGIVHITNNQRSADPNKAMVLRTTGPVFYRESKNLDAKAPPGAATGPDIWTDAAVEIVDRANLPRGFGAPAPATIQTTGPELLLPGVIQAILAGRRLPPPTVAAIGMKIFLDNASSQAAGPKPPSALGGIRRIELQEKVLVNLWVDARQSLVSGKSSPEPAKGGASANPLNRTPPAAANGAIAGGAFFALQDVSQLDRALLQVDTLGRFVYDGQKNVAQFDVLPNGNPDLPNDVQVHRVPPNGIGTQRLFSQFLEIEFDGPAVGPQPPGPTKPAAPAAPAATGIASASSATSFKVLRAWVETPGRFVTISSDGDRLEAYGDRLTHEQATNTTTLRGAPLHAVRSNEPRADNKLAGGNVLMAGSKARPALLTLKPGLDEEKSIVATVEGPGRIELFDPATNENTIHATWQHSLVQTKQSVDRRDLDVFTFTDAATFKDIKADYWLKGNEIELWMESTKTIDANGGPRAGSSTNPVPHRVKATGAVTGHSSDFDIERTDTLTVFFRDGVAPRVANVPIPPAPVVPSGPLVKAGPAGLPQPALGPEPPKEPEKPKPPMKIQARVIDTWVVRYPVPIAAAPKPLAVRADDKPALAPNGPGDSSMKYELEKVRCEGSVIVHQDPVEPAPDKRGVDILGQTLLVDHTPDGSVMTVTGIDEQRPGQVHRDGMSIVGPRIVIDQLHNVAEVEGRGSLIMPSNSDLAGGELRQPSVVVVHWRDAMKFEGARKRAEFFGKVTAQQNESFITCHTMQVQFDREVDFSPRSKPAAAPAPKIDPRLQPVQKSNPKIEAVNCYPAPDEARDEPKDAKWVTFRETTRDETGKIAKTRLLTARELEMKVKLNEQHLVAQGPGTLRLWELGEKDEAAGPAVQPPPNKPKESVMKLTIVQFAGQMVAADKGKVFQEATFHDTIEVIHAPSERADADFDRHRLPAGTVRLTCAEKLVVSARKQMNAPTLQRMDAYGNAYIRSDEYDGWGEKVTSEFATITLFGGKNALARIYNRFNKTESTGEEIVYNRAKGGYQIKGNAGTTIQGSPSPR